MQDMEITEGQQEVIITMSRDEFSTFRGAYQNAWFFIQEAARISIPSGQTFGRGLAPEVELEDLRDRVRRLESQTKALEETIEKLKEWPRSVRLLERITALENGSRLVGTGIDPEKVKAIDRRLVGIEHKIEWIQESGASAQLTLDSQLETVSREHGQRLQELETRLDAYGVPVAKVVVDENLPAGMVVMGDPRDLARPTMNYLSDKQTLQIAEDRVRRYMTGHWSDASVDAVVAALRGESVTIDISPEAMNVTTGRVEPSSEYRPVRKPLITDHHFRYEAPDRRHCAYQSDEGDEKCGEGPLRHSRP